MTTHVIPELVPDGPDRVRWTTVLQSYDKAVASLCLYICFHHFLYISILCWRGESGRYAPTPLREDRASVRGPRTQEPSRGQERLTACLELR